ncbi:MAG TPA: hypothetical protein VF376_02410 [Thermoanaerobaculia bacterium]
MRTSIVIIPTKGQNGWRALAFSVIFGAVLISYPARGVAQSTPEAKAKAEGQNQERDGSHDFDPLFGKWKFHLRRRLNPLTGSNKWIDLEGTGECHKIFESGANIDQVILEGGGTHIEGLTLRTYNPQTHEWNLYWANRKIGHIDVPQIGKFKDGHGEFYGLDTINNQTLIVKFDWSRLNTDSPHFEQSFSPDGGKTWEVNWITDQVRVKE